MWKGNENLFCEVAAPFAGCMIKIKLIAVINVLDMCLMFSITKNNI